MGLSQAQWQALASLWQQQGVNQVTLAERLEIQPITLVRLIDRLQEAGLVDRKPDPEDRRAVQLFLTDKAEPLLDRMWEFATETREQAMGSLTEREREALIESENARHRRGLITVSIILATIMQALDTTIAYVALPRMQGSMSATQDQISWVLMSYIVAAAIMKPATGVLAA
jgi:DNA-binding MarR family transcriptional regulator